MNAKDILKNIPNKEGAGYFTVHLPSLNKDLRIKHLSVNDQKIISKLAIDDEGTTFASEADLAKIALVETNALDSIDLGEIDLRDFFILCCAIRKENYMDEFEIRYTCEQCEEKFNKPIEFDRLIENAREYEVENDTVEIKTKRGDIKVKIGIPSQLDLVMLEMYYKKVAQTREVVIAEKYVDYIICCMKEVQMKNSDDEWESVEDFPGMNYLEKVNFIQGIEANIEQISKLFKSIGMITSNFFYEVDCPNCGNKLRAFLDTSDFFTL